MNVIPKSKSKGLGERQLAAGCRANCLHLRAEWGMLPREVLQNEVISEIGSCRFFEKEDLHCLNNCTGVRRPVSIRM